MKTKYKNWEGWLYYGYSRNQVNMANELSYLHRKGYETRWEKLSEKHWDIWIRNPKSISKFIK